MLSIRLIPAIESEAVGCKRHLPHPVGAMTRLTRSAGGNEGWLWRRPSMKNDGIARNARCSSRGMRRNSRSNRGSRAKVGYALRRGAVRQVVLGGRDALEVGDELLVLEDGPLDWTEQVGKPQELPATSPADYGRAYYSHSGPRVRSRGASPRLTPTPVAVTSSGQPPTLTTGLANPPGSPKFHGPVGAGTAPPQRQESTGSSGGPTAINCGIGPRRPRVPASVDRGDRCAARAHLQRLVWKWNSRGDGRSLPGPRAPKRVLRRRR